jgi:hypothetical protein
MYINAYIQLYVLTFIDALPIEPLNHGIHTYIHTLCTDPHVYRLRQFEPRLGEGARGTAGRERLEECETVLQLRSTRGATSNFILQHVHTYIHTFIHIYKHTNMYIYVRTYFVGNYTCTT